MDVVLWSLLLSTIGAASAINAATGGTAFLYGNSPVSPNQQVDWSVDVTGTVIATRSPGANSTYVGRCGRGRCILHDNGTLQMEQLRAADNGTYTVKLQAGVVVITEKVQLNVYDLLIAPLLLVSSTIRPVNGSNLSLTCHAGAQTVHSIYFYRDEELLSCSALHLSCSRFDTNLSFSPILASDSGNYTCGIENPVSSNRSTAVYVDVAVNVSEVTLRSNVTRPVVAEKEVISLICSSYGTEVTYSWMLNDLPLPDNPRYELINSNSTLVISPVSRGDEGTFTCRVSNYLNSETSGPFNLSWFPDGHIQCGAERSAGGVHLYCKWPGGNPPAVVQLMYENFSQSAFDEATMEVPSQQFSLGTKLTCSGNHAGSNDVCSLVIDAPQSAGFINDSVKTAAMGSSAFLSVTLERGQAQDTQVFPAKFSWFLLDPSPTEVVTSDKVSIIANDFSSFLIIPAMSKELSGHYMCRTENPMGSNSFTFILNVKEEEILSAGAIAGIVIGSVGAVALIALIVLLIFRDRNKTTTKQEDDQSHTLQDRVNPYQPSPRNVSYENEIPESSQESETYVQSNPSETGTYEDSSQESETYVQSNPSDTGIYEEVSAPDSGGNPYENRMPRAAHRVFTHRDTPTTLLTSRSFVGAGPVAGSTDVVSPFMNTRR